MLGALLFLRAPVTEGQQNFPQPNRKPACTCFCGDATFHSFNVFPVEAQRAGVCFGGPLPADKCGEDLANMPPGELRALCQRANARDLECPALKPLCGSRSGPTEKGCNDPATPWFGDSPGCKDVQAPAVAINNGAVTVSVCGYPVFRGVDPSPIAGVDPATFLNAYLPVMKDHVKSQVGSRVCCDKLREAARTGNPCYPAQDIDCDGKPNASDITTSDGGVTYPDINLFSKQVGAAVDEFPFGLDPDDPNFLPAPTARDSKGVGECPCKWELTKGTLTCSPDGVKDHVYTATWKCPVNGKEVFTTKYAKASAECKPPDRRATVFRDSSFIEFISPNLRARSCR